MGQDNSLLEKLVFSIIQWMHLNVAESLFLAAECEKWIQTTVQVDDKTSKTMSWFGVTSQEASEKIASGTQQRDQEIFGWRKV